MASLQGRLALLITAIGADIKALQTAQASAAAGIPRVISQGTTYTVPTDQQVLFHSEIKLDGELILRGELIQV